MCSTCTCKFTCALLGISHIAPGNILDRTPMVFMCVHALVSYYRLFSPLSQCALRSRWFLGWQHHKGEGERGDPVRHGAAVVR